MSSFLWRGQVCQACGGKEQAGSPYPPSNLGSRIRIPSITVAKISLMKMLRETAKPAASIRVTYPPADETPDERTDGKLFGYASTSQLIPSSPTSAHHAPWVGGLETDRSSLYHRSPTSAHHAFWVVGLEIDRKPPKRLGRRNGDERCSVSPWVVVERM